MSPISDECWLRTSVHARLRIDRADGDRAARLTPANWGGRPAAVIRNGLQNAAALQVRIYLARNFSMIGARNEPRGFLTSLWPVSRRAISRNILVVRCRSVSSAIIWPLLAALPNN
jgi:hypothetical protein